MKATVPTNQHRAQACMHKHFGLNQHEAKPIAPLGKRTIGAHIHGHADDVYPGQNGGVKRKKNKEKGDINAPRQ
ncbi:hypothetical protein D3C77_582650 [compost metagenome]